MGTRAACITVVLVALCGPVAMGAMFINPPETYAGPGEWLTPFPYQRNMMIDFATDPHGWPTDPVNPLAYDLTPLPPTSNYDLEGTLDPSLYDSDWLHIMGDFTWLPVDTFLGSGRTGLLLFDNSGGSDPMNVMLQWHIDNTEDANLCKDIWSELVWLQGSVDTSIEMVPGARRGTR